MILCLREWFCSKSYSISLAENSKPRQCVEGTSPLCTRLRNDYYNCCNQKSPRLSFQTYTCDVFFAQSWKDNRLRLPDNMTSEYRLLPIEWLTQIWRPDSFFKNAKDVTFQTMTIPNHYIWLWKDKTILYMVK